MKHRKPHKSKPRQRRQYLRELPKEPSTGGFLGWVARNVTIIKLLLMLVMFVLIGVLVYNITTVWERDPDFGTNPPTPTTVTPIPGSLPPSPSVGPTPGPPPSPAAIAGAVVGGVALLALAIYGIVRAVQTGKMRPGPGLTNF